MPSETSASERNSGKLDAECKSAEHWYIVEWSVAVPLQQIQQCQQQQWNREQLRTGTRSNNPRPKINSMINWIFDFQSNVFKIYWNRFE